MNKLMKSQLYIGLSTANNTVFHDHW